MKLSLFCIIAAAQAVTLATFGSDNKFKWEEENDPVMGGVSFNCTFKVDKSAATATFEGEVKIVPSLKAPGFCFARTKDTKSSDFADVSSAKNLELVLKNTGDVQKFHMAFSADTLIRQFKCFKADFNTTSSQDFQTVKIPFGSFSNEWSQSTGEPTGKSPPSKKNLHDIEDLQIWAEGTAGKFHLEIKEIRAV